MLLDDPLEDGGCELAPLVGHHRVAVAVALKDRDQGQGGRVWKEKINALTQPYCCFIKFIEHSPPTCSRGRRCRRPTRLAEELLVKGEPAGQGYDATDLMGRKNINGSIFD